MGLALACLLAACPGSRAQAQGPQGAELAGRLGCLACHALNRPGGKPAAALDGVGARLTTAELAQRHRLSPPTSPPGQNAQLCLPPPHGAGGPGGIPPNPPMVTRIIRIVGAVSRTARYRRGDHKAKITVMTATCISDHRHHSGPFSPAGAAFRPLGQKLPHRCCPLPRGGLQGHLLPGLRTWRATRSTAAKSVQGLRIKDFKAGMGGPVCPSYEACR